MMAGAKSDIPVINILIYFLKEKFQLYVILTVQNDMELLRIKEKSHLYKTVFLSGNKACPLIKSLFYIHLLV